MAGYIVFAGMNINYIEDEINITKNRQYSTSEYIGAEGSNTNYVSGTGRIISFKSICKWNEESAHNNPHRINDYIDLVNTNKDKVKVLTSPSKSNINGNYICTGFDYTEDTRGNYVIDWEFMEVIKFNATKKTFRVWGKSASTTSTKTKKTKTKTSGSNNLSSNTKYLLKTCPTMKRGHSGKKCVKSLQKFLQSKGYYKGYKVDGLYEIYTFTAVKNLQKKFKLRTTGNWDKTTRSYFQKKYKYPASVSKKK